MTAIEVAKLKVSCTAQQRDRARFAIEDGLRTSIPDDRRLVLLRKMQLRSQASSQAPAIIQAAVRNGWLAAISGARHGGDDGAADANCVWFASYEEAEALLLSRLLAGRLVDAWFWKLAVPDWRGRPPRDWVPNSISEAIGRGQDRRVLALVRCFITAGAIEQLIEAIADPSSMAVRVFPFRESFRHPPAAEPSDDRGLAEDIERIAGNFVAVMPPELLRLIVRLSRTGDHAEVMAHAITRAWILKQSPALALSPPLLANILAATIAAIVSPPATGWARRPAGQPGARRDIRLAGQLADDTPAASAVESPARAQVEPARPAARDAGGATSKSEAESLLSEGAQPAPHRLYSAHAGLWLVVPSLVELGFPDWLEQRPALLGENPGGQLIREIARYHRVAPDDLALAIVGELPDTLAPRDWPRMWRQGLDRWLRRTVRRRLHDLVNRPGELDCSESSMTIHYPAADADLALRRQALDRDPGWTAWLGLSIRYNFGGKEDWV